MAKKYIVQNAQVLEVVSVHGCQTARGGRRKPIEEEGVYLKENKTLQDKLESLFPEPKKLVGKYNEKNHRATLKRRREALQELVVNNFSPFHSAMLTLTFQAEQKEAVTKETASAEQADDWEKLGAMYDLLGSGKLLLDGTAETETVPSDVKVYDPEREKLKQLSHCNALFKKFVQRMKYRYEGFKYVAVAARQENGRWHYHLVCNLTYIPFQQLRDCWGHGAVYFRNFRESGAEGFWAAIRYLQKNMRAEADDLKGEKGYLASKGLNRSKVYRSWVDGEREAVRQIESALRGAEPFYQYQTTHEYEGGAPDGVFVQDVTATYKYYAYRQDNSSLFPKLPVAKKQHGL